MSSGELYIGGQWRVGGGERLTSTNPATEAVVFDGAGASAADAAAAVAAARAAFGDWAETSLDQRIAIVRRYKEILAERADAISRAISDETGKPLWETKTEVASMMGKVDISIRAVAERAGSREAATAFGRAVLRHRPHGVMAVLGPFNFPGHLPNGHIVPALLAGDVIVFKPSEETPSVGRHMAEALAEAGVPAGVFNLIQGGREAGAALLDQEIDGLLFTGSANAGDHFRRQFVDRPEVILALELGGNNPLIVWNAEPEVAAQHIVQSAFVTTGQRCSCARRLIVQDGPAGDAIIAATLALTDRLIAGPADQTPEPYMGPVISARAAVSAIARFEAIAARGAKVLRPLAHIDGLSKAFLSPGVLDVTGVEGIEDEEIFAPALQIYRVADFDAAIAQANATRYGLSAGLVGGDEALWTRFLARIRAGVVNWNRPTTGAAGDMPFGGLGRSGNHKPSAYYAADYCAYPVASFEATAPAPLLGEMKGLKG
jgi:succinylglutamic semialdehyde dehydrogenase